MSLSDCDNILVRGVNWIGDAVMTMPALRALRLAKRSSAITLLVKPWVAPLFERDPNINEIVLYSDAHHGIKGRINLARTLKSRRFCAALLFQNAFDAAVIAGLAGIPDRIGYGRDARGFLLTKAVCFDDPIRRLHHVDYYLNLIAEAGLPAVRSLPWIYLQFEERLGARDALKGLKRPIVAMNPGASYGSSKRWHAERFAEVGARVINELGGSVLVLGGPADKDLADEISGVIGRVLSRPAYEESLLCVAGRTTLRELAALVSESDLLVTNDSGPMHIGYAVGTPLVAVFGSTSPELTGPLGAGSRAIKKGLECSPCFERTCKPGHLKCMDLIEAADVFDEVRSLIGAKKAVFFDRDGTLCRDADFLNRMEDFEIFSDIKSLERLRARGFSLIGVSNQSGIARGLVDESFVRKVNQTFIHSHGFEDFYYCPHHPDDNCSCRKPEPGLLYQARAEHKIDLKVSYVVGDKDADMLLAKSVGAMGILVKTGKDDASPHADFIADDLAGVVAYILGRSGA